MIGYACISIPMRELGIYTSRTATLKTLRANPGLASELARANIADLEKIIIYNEQRGLRFFRISSGLLPHMSSEFSEPGYEVRAFKTELARCGRLAREWGHRLTMHPGQYVQLGSPRDEVVAASVEEMRVGAEIMKALGCAPPTSCLVIHLGGHFNDRAGAMARWRATFETLPSLVAEYIAIENDELWSLAECLELWRTLRGPVKPPIVVDFFHDTLNPTPDLVTLLPAVAETWTVRGGRPKCHVSEQKVDAGGPKKVRRGAHSESIDEIPAIALKYRDDWLADIMLEVKDKDVSALAMYEKYYCRETKSVRIRGDMVARTEYFRCAL
jgi:UV DNA damage endonuclease